MENHHAIKNGVYHLFRLGSSKNHGKLLVITRGYHGHPWFTSIAVWEWSIPGGPGEYAWTRNQRNQRSSNDRRIVFQVLSSRSDQGRLQDLVSWLSEDSHISRPQVIDLCSFMIFRPTTYDFPSIYDFPIDDLWSLRSHFWWFLCGQWHHGTMASDISAWRVESSSCKRPSSDLALERWASNDFNGCLEKISVLCDCIPVRNVNCSGGTIEECQ